MILSALKRPRVALVAIVIVAAGGYVVRSELIKANLRTDLAQAGESLQQRAVEIRSLVSSIEDQSAQVDQWRQAAESRAKAAHEAMREAQARVDQVNETIGRMRAQDAQTCEEAMPLVYEVMGL